MSAPVATVILAAGTGAGDSEAFVVGQGRVTAMLTAPLTASDVITLQYQTPAGTWVDAADQSFAGVVRFSATVNMLQIDGAGVYRFNRPSIGTSVGVFIRGKNV
jgi:hypothetical protein